MIKRFKFLVIILVVSIYSKINCSGFERDLNNAISDHVDFDSLTPEQEACYLPQIHKKGIVFMPINWACLRGNSSAFKWLLSKGVVPIQECFVSAIVGDNPQAEIVSGLLSLGLYTEYIYSERTLKKLQDRLSRFYYLENLAPDCCASKIAETEKTIVLIKRYEEVGLRSAWVGAVVRAQVAQTGLSCEGAGSVYAGAGSGAVVSGYCVEIEE